MPHATPLNQRVLPDGSVVFEFAGHISAEGVDLLAGTTASPPDDRRIRWLREADGSLVASMYGYETASTDAAIVSAGDDNGVVPRTATAGMQAVNNGTHIAVITATAAQGGLAEARARASDPSGVVTANSTRKIIDENGYSDFIQAGHQFGPPHRIELAWDGTNCQLYVDGINIGAII